MGKEDGESVNAVTTLLKLSGPYMAPLLKSAIRQIGGEAGKLMTSKFHDDSSESGKKKSKEDAKPAAAPPPQQPQQYYYPQDGMYGPPAAQPQYLPRPYAPYPTPAVPPPQHAHVPSTPVPSAHVASATPASPAAPPTVASSPPQAAPIAVIVEPTISVAQTADADGDIVTVLRSETHTHPNRKAQLKAELAAIELEEGKSAGNKNGDEDDDSVDSIEIISKHHSSKKHKAERKSKATKSAISRSSSSRKSDHNSRSSRSRRYATSSDEYDSDIDSDSASSSSTCSSEHRPSSHRRNSRHSRRRSKTRHRSRSRSRSKSRTRSHHRHIYPVGIPPYHPQSNYSGIHQVSQTYPYDMPYYYGSAPLSSSSYTPAPTYMLPNEYELPGPEFDNLSRGHSRGGTPAPPLFNSRSPAESSYDGYGRSYHVSPSGERPYANPPADRSLYNLRDQWGMRQSPQEYYSEA